jgi:hypothetical protein
MKTEKLNLYYLGLASLFAAKSSDARYMLASVHAEPCKNDKGAYIVATDGHRLVVYHDKGAYLNEPILLSTDNKEFFAFAKKKPTDPGVMVAIERVSGAVNLGMDNGTRYTVRVLSAKFPKWQQVIDPKQYQTGDKVNQMYMNAAYLKDLWPIIPKTNGKMHYLHAYIGGPGTLVDDGRRFKVAPTLFYPDGNSEHEFFALIMPVSTQGTTPEIPSWLNKLN